MLPGTASYSPEIALAYSPDGMLLAVGGRTKATQVLDMKTGEVKYALPASRFADDVLAFSSDSSVLATLSSDLVGVRLWNAATGERLRGGRLAMSGTIMVDHFAIQSGWGPHRSRQSWRCNPN